MTTDDLLARADAYMIDSSGEALLIGDLADALRERTAAALRGEEKT